MNWNNQDHQQSKAPDQRAANSKVMLIEHHLLRQRLAARWAVALAYTLRKARLSPQSMPEEKTMAIKGNERGRSKAVKSEAQENKSAPDSSEQNQKATLKGVGGGDDNHWNSRIGRSLFASLPGVTPVNASEAGRATLSGLLDINATDPIEGMLASQIIAAHEASMHLRQLAWIPEQHFVVQAKYLELAEKAARTVGVLTERLDQHRGRGQQQITVKHVTVNADQAVVTDTITSDRAPLSTAMPLNNLLTAGRQCPMDILTTESYVAVGGGAKEK
ncbi:hypothetical protein [Bradyrhizobium sp. JYMT SZCCT0428]|uniref:hypothetical protein n=1 Tax=Bradyrhizobium sp. JYMT SZCCT0428 TaxID=2807673 RepID=UPI001BA814A4|nr:hypothetical protein [Bradyrhizobium sp. JYMT SZCCT0428]MBR1156518.1 hypothetical protein [Bradyrhizobium sp. JYMT SZCCT0428]